MIRYAGHFITFQEVPGEVSLVFTITGCPRNCDGCHSPWLRDPNHGVDIEETFYTLLEKYGGDITCVCFMGEGQDPDTLSILVKHVQDRGLRVALYTGADSLEELPPFVKDFNYIKLGHYDKERGGLDNPGTNQRFYWNRTAGTMLPPDLMDLTYLFERKHYFE